MNIDKNKLRKRLALFGAPITNSGIDSILETCEIKSVDCDECSNMGEVCNKCIHNKFSDDYFKQKEQQWYEKPESFPCLCWVSDNIPVKTDHVGLVVEFDDRFITSEDISWNHVIPFTKPELLKYCLEEK